jgi:hypothetical protein
MKHAILRMFIALSAAAGLIGCGSLDDGDSKHDAPVNVEEKQSPLETDNCDDSCVSLSIMGAEAPVAFGPTDISTVG